MSTTRPQSLMRSCLMYAIIDRSTSNFIHNCTQYPKIYYDSIHANRECVRLRRASHTPSLEVIRCRLVEVTKEETLSQSSSIDSIKAGSI